MGRLLDEDAVIKEIKEWQKAFRANCHRESVSDVNLILDAIKNLPSAQQEQQWILCSERMPEDYVDVLVWFEYFRYGNYNRMYATHGIGNYSKEYNSWTINHETGWKDLHVFAWMPLPGPYEDAE